MTTKDDQIKLLRATLKNCSDIMAEKGLCNEAYEIDVLLRETAATSQPAAETDEAEVFKKVIAAANKVLDYVGRKCWRDHNGNCQEHGISNPCEVAELIAAIEAWQTRTIPAPAPADVVELFKAEMLKLDYHPYSIEMTESVDALKAAIAAMQPQRCEITDNTPDERTINLLIMKELQRALPPEQEWLTGQVAWQVYERIKPYIAQSVREYVAPEIQAIIDAARVAVGDPYDPATIAAKFDLHDAVNAYEATLDPESEKS